MFSILCGDHLNDLKVPSLCSSNLHILNILDNFITKFCIDDDASWYLSCDISVNKILKVKRKMFEHNVVFS